MVIVCNQNSICYVVRGSTNKRATTDAEAAFKKLTAAFEKLNDPAQQAASRAEAGRRRHPRGNRGGSSFRGPSSDNNYTGSGASGGGSGGGGTGSGTRETEAPRWCREGEYVPASEREEESKEPDTGKRKVWCW